MELENKQLPEENLEEVAGGTADVRVSGRIFHNWYCPACHKDVDYVLFNDESGEFLCTVCDTIWKDLTAY